MKKNNKGKIVSVDIDGCIAQPLNDKDRHKYWLCDPYKEMIKKVNKLFEDRYVIIYNTGRAPKYYKETFAWLIKQGCKFHALRMGKLRADYYIDDHGVSDINFF